MVKQLFSSYLQAQPRCKQLCCSLLGCAPMKRLIKASGLGLPDTTDRFGLKS
ncbi:hypothetical protein VIBHAR_05057 [Vibrio campbellii ATCC BAA-1116]|uniref:Uncharacterized protein n=1 Tax=Vibrio campbellii (strain ATCC BAA-1116) TaxID=2902295 RepID=A7N374_VIBC1|nr:hypothetical protein VIBHAR_05057 [Vibrio campbellii ATCC BAA-1116]